MSAFAKFLTRALLYSSLLLCTGFLYSCEEKAADSNTDNTTVDTPDNKEDNTVGPTVEPRQVLEKFTGLCTKMNDTGCGCDYKLKGEGVNTSSFFVSDWAMNACVQVAGQMQELVSKEGVYREQLRERVDYARNNEEWITIPNQGDILYFGAPAPKDQEELQYLTHILLMMDEIPAQLSISHEDGDSRIAKVRDMVSDAIEQAKDRQSKGTYQFFEEDIYYNDTYQVIVDTKNMTNYEGEADTYEGTLTLKDKAGNILHTQPVSGTCGC